MPAEKLALRKEIAELKNEVEYLRMQVANLTTMLKLELGVPKASLPSKSKTARISN
ncbi:MAG: hypothetical protein LV481_01405 [Methylacidiphilales bacterium]|nr:hypothetical protein [Candidatus Methylacidiphilales bacterium]